MSVRNGDVMLHIYRLVCIIYTQCVGALLLRHLHIYVTWCWYYTYNIIPCPNVMLHLSIIMLEGEANLFLTVL